MRARREATGRFVGLAISCAALSLSVPPCAGQCHYEVTVLGSTDRPEPYAVNDSGYVVGVLLHFPTDFDAFLWPGQDPVVRLSMPSGPHSTAYDITEARVVVGFHRERQARVRQR